MARFVEIELTPLGADDEEDVMRERCVVVMEYDHEQRAGA